MAPTADMRRRRTGVWRVGRQDAVLAQPNRGIIYRFHARDLHLVLGPAPDGIPVKFEVLIELVRLAGDVTDHTFEIRFLDPGATAYSFTFG
jgi:hypothetical protein